MKIKIKKRINELQLEVDVLRTMLRVINYDIFYRNLIICEIGKLQIHFLCKSGQTKMEEINRLMNLLKENN